MNVTDMTPGVDYTVSTAKGDVTGTFVSVNSKGVNLKVDGKVISRSLKSVTGVAPVGDGYTTRQAADKLGLAPKVLRVHLRALAMNVGKGHTYLLTDADLDKVRNHLAANADA